MALAESFSQVAVVVQTLSLPKFIIIIQRIWKLWHTTNQQIARARISTSAHASWMYMRKIIHMSMNIKLILAAKIYYSQSLKCPKLPISAWFSTIYNMPPMRGLYIFYPLFEDHFFVFNEVFFFICKMCFILIQYS